MRIIKFYTEYAFMYLVTAIVFLIVKVLRLLEFVLLLSVTVFTSLLSASFLLFFVPVFFVAYLLLKLSGYQYVDSFSNDSHNYSRRYYISFNEDFNKTIDVDIAIRKTFKSFITHNCFDHKTSISFTCFLSVYVHFSRVLPVFLYKVRKEKNSNPSPGIYREWQIGLSFQNHTYISFLTSLSGHDKERWYSRDIYYTLADFIGRELYSEEIIDYSEIIMPLPEKDYNLVVLHKIIHRTYPWHFSMFNKSEDKYEIYCGNFVHVKNFNKNYGFTLLKFIENNRVELFELRKHINELQGDIKYIDQYNTEWGDFNILNSDAFAFKFEHIPPGSNSRFGLLGTGTTSIFDANSSSEAVAEYVKRIYLTRMQNNENYALDEYLEIDIEGIDLPFSDEKQ